MGEDRVSWGQPRLPSQESGSPIIGGFLYLCLHPLTQNDQIRHDNTYGEGLFQEVSHAVVFVQMRRAVCRFLFLDSVDCITTITAEYAVEIVNFPYT